MNKTHERQLALRNSAHYARGAAAFAKRRAGDFLAGVLRHTSAVWIFCLLAVFFTFTPGYMSPDSLNSWRGASALDSLIIYHPPFMSYIFWVGRQLTADQSGILFLQLLLFFSGLRLILSETISSRVARSAILILISIWPAIFPILGVLWKSVWMTGFLLVALGLTLRYFRTTSPWAVIGAVIAVCFAMLARYDAIAPAGVILFVIAYRSYRIFWPRPSGQKVSLTKITSRVGSSLAIGVAGVLGLGTVVSSINNAITVGTLHPSHVFLYQDLLSVSVNSGEVFVPNYVRAENPNLTVAQLAAAYDPSTCNAFLKYFSQPDNAPYKLRRPANIEEADQFKQEWIRAVTTHPGAYLEGRRGLLASLWGFKDRPHLPYYSRVNDNEMGLKSDPAPLKSAAYEYARFVSYEIKWFHRPWVYILAALVVFSCFMLRFGAPVAPACFLFPAVGLAHFAAMSGLSCAGDFRFAYFMVCCTMIGGMIAILGIFKPSAFLKTDTAWIR